MDPTEPPTAPADDNAFSLPPPPPGPLPGAVENPPPRRRMRWYSWVAIGISVLVLVVGVAGFVKKMPYSEITPGDAVSLNTLVHVSGTKTFPDKTGDIRLLYVRERNNISYWRYLFATFDKNAELLKNSAVNPTNEPQPDLDAEAVADMSDAKIAATKVALEAAGFTVKPAPGYVVQAVLPSKPASKVLKAGDLIVTADGKQVVQGADLTAAVRAHHAGGTITLGIVRAGKPMTVKVGIAQTKDGPEMGVRVFQHYEFPVQVSVDTAGIGGPSGGLAMTLAILDQIQPGNLTGGKRVAVTGTIDSDGNVGEIGGIAQKAVAARARHSNIFIVPACLPSGPEPVPDCKKDLATAQQKAGPNLQVIPVATFAEALAVLHNNGGAPVVKVGPTLTAAA